jgi:hypothetical protein
MRAAELQNQLVDALDLISNRKAELAQQKGLLEQQQAAAKRANPTLEPDEKDATKVALKAIGEQDKALDEAAKGLWLNSATNKGIAPQRAAFDKLSEAMWMLDGNLDAPSAAALSYLNRAAALIEARISAAQTAIAHSQVSSPVPAK